MQINKILFYIITIILVVITLLTIIIVPREIDESYNNTTNTTSLDLSNLNISDISLSSNSSYNVCTGTISVDYSSQYKYHFIKVKASFMNDYGKVVDTDWSYAIGSEWLEPGESSKFRLSVAKDYNISKCVVTIMEE